MKNSYGISYIENPFQIVPDFIPEYLTEPQSLPYIKIGKMVFIDDQIKIEGKKIFFASDIISGMLVIFRYINSFFEKKERMTIDIKDIKFFKTYRIISGIFKLEWQILNFKIKDIDLWIMPNGFFGNKKHFQKILTNFKNI